MASDLESNKSSKPIFIIIGLALIGCCVSSSLSAGIYLLFNKTNVVTIDKNIDKYKPEECIPVSEMHEPKSHMFIDGLVLFCNLFIWIVIIYLYYYYNCKNKTN